MTHFTFTLKETRTDHTVNSFADPEKPIINIHKINNENISPIKEFYKNFELSLVQLFVFGLVFTPTHTYVFYKSHHIIADGWGMTQVAEQIKEIYSKLLSGETLDNYTNQVTQA